MEPNINPINDHFPDANGTQYILVSYQSGQTYSFHNDLNFGKNNPAGLSFHGAIYVGEAHPWSILGPQETVRASMPHGTLLYPAHGRPSAESAGPIEYGTLSTSAVPWYMEHKG